MDAYISSDAERTLQGLGDAGCPASGLLIGHRRGPRFFVESVLPTRSDFFPSLRGFFSLSSLFEDRLIGFYSFRRDRKSLKKILAPFACGLLFIHVRTSRKRDPDLAAFSIEFKGRFDLAPIGLEAGSAKEDRRGQDP